MRRIYILMILVIISSAYASLNCNEEYDTKEEFRELSGKLLIEYLENPKESKINGLEVSQLSIFYETYQDSWENANCEEKGVSGKSINEIILKYRGGIGSLNFYPFIGLGFLVLAIGFLIYKKFNKNAVLHNY